MASKCLPSVNYLGYKINADGLHPFPEKARAIKKAPKPKNTTELKAYLRLIMHLRLFSSLPVHWFISLIQVVQTGCMLALYLQAASYLSKGAGPLRPKT